MAAAQDNTTSSERTMRVLSLQSHSVHGYVGNKAATFPLQCLGFDVSAINTITLSNRPGYSGRFAGEEMDPEELLTLINGLQANSLLDFDMVISGYVKSAPLLRCVRDSIDMVRNNNESAFVVCDPVLGDNGAYYVSPELLQEYRSEIIPRSDVVIPNAFEATLLTGVEVKSVDSAREACRRLHQLGPQYCLLKGVNLHGNDSTTLSMVLSRKEDRTLYCIDTPRLDLSFYGCGDLCTAIASAWLLRQRGDLSLCLEKIAGTMQEVMASTAQQKTCHELRIIENRDAYINPPVPATAAYPIHGQLSGLIFDMDGTLTEPGAIDFAAMYKRIGIEPRGGDILTQISQELPLERHEDAHAIIIDEELKGCDAMKLMPDLKDLLDYIDSNDIKAAISTRNCAEAFQRFQLLAGLKDNSFTPILSRESLNGINKPDPKVAHHIIEQWGAAGKSHEIWFIGDSVDDMKCGKGAGCRTCYLNPEGTYIPAHAEYIDICVKSLSEFIDHIRYHDIRK